MRCDLIHRQLSDYLDGELTPNIAETVEIHLATCHACASELQALRRTVRMVVQVEDAEPIPQERLFLLQEQVLQQARVNRCDRWLLHLVRGLRFYLQFAQTRWVDLMDTGTWPRRLRYGLVMLMLVLVSVWVDRQYFRPDLSEMIRDAFVPQTSYAPAAMVGPSDLRNLRQLHRLNRATEEIRNQDTLARLTQELSIPLPDWESNRMEVRVVESRDGKLVFIGTLDMLEPSHVEEGDVPLSDVTMPTSSPTVVMLPRHFDEPSAPERGGNTYLFADLLYQTSYPVASPTDLVIEEE